MPGRSMESVTALPLLGGMFTYCLHLSRRVQMDFDPYGLFNQGWTLATKIVRIWLRCRSHWGCVKPQAADALSRLKTTRIDQMPIVDKTSVLCVTESIPSKNESQGLFICLITSHWRERKALHYLQYTPLPYPRKLNTTNVQWTHKSSYISRQKIVNAARRYLQLDYWNPRLTTTGMGFPFVLPPRVKQYRKSILLPYNPLLYNTRIIPQWKATRVKEVYTTRCEAKHTFHTWQMQFTKV